MIPQWFENLSPIVQALLAGCFTWAITAAGAALVFLTRSVRRRLVDVMLGFAAGVMIAASFWSLLVPAIDLAEHQGMISWVPALIGFILGGAFLRITGAVLPRHHSYKLLNDADGLPATWPRAVLLVNVI